VRDGLEIFVEIILAIAGAVFFGSLAVAIGAVALGCVLFGSCWSFLGWRRRRAERLKERS
jgi:CBS-domain-containing membrane protein